MVLGVADSRIQLGRRGHLDFLEFQSQLRGSSPQPLPSPRLGELCRGQQSDAPQRRDCLVQKLKTLRVYLLR
jgi:hypothetical protein